MYPKYSTLSRFFSDSPRATTKEPPPPSGLLSIVVVSRDPLQPRRQLPASQHQRHSEPDHGGEWGGRGRRAQVVDAAPGEQAAAGERSMRETSSVGRTVNVIFVLRIVKIFRCHPAIVSEKVAMQ